MQPRSSRFLRLLLVLPIILLLAAAAFLYAQRQHAIAERDALIERFEREVAPLPDDAVPIDESASSDPELARLTRARALEADAERAFAAGDFDAVLEATSDLAKLRDEILAEPLLVDQIVGMAVGKMVLEQTHALVATGALGAERTERLSWTLGGTDDQVFRATLAADCARFLRTLRDAAEQASWRERWHFELAGPATEASIVALHLGIAQAARDPVADVQAHVASLYEAPPLILPSAQILIPNLADVAIKRRAYALSSDLAAAAVATATTADAAARVAEIEDPVAGGHVVVEDAGDGSLRLSAPEAIAFLARHYEGSTIEPPIPPLVWEVVVGEGEPENESVEGG